MRQLVQSLRTTLGGSAYATYYQQKGEEQDLVYSNDWNAKQKSVHRALSQPNIRTVLDVACNTGWFALMAEKLGKEVVAFDIDEGCVEALYSQVSQSGLNILPLVMSFSALTPDRYSIHDGRKVLINATDRLRSDSVLALGIIHHLVLGLGLSFDEVLDTLISLCNKQLVIEFVEPHDPMIQGEPSFFPAFYKNNSLLLNYDRQSLISRIESRGFQVITHASHPSSRAILICDRYTQ
jgi:SAM-dependent methyltransferase